ncbi:MAG TPA: FxDxF family PEP-CTERM protein [Marinagarivorans sp.]|nr:FxDxF family PEP-CTERM protein [Cellvibrionaceae bacterium]HMY39003.1 FxDxF family PEP-CTERM protein [Marinagarivorans sp.]HNG61640.1 FxDxF family PEP-CTERM protein [Cellvibrionaceae bacterium]
MALKAVSVLTPLVGQLVLAATLLSAQPASAQMVDLGDFTAPSTLSYQNSFNGQHNQFTDWYAFSVPATQFNGITASISFAQLFGVQLTSELYHGSLSGNQVNLGAYITGGATGQTVFGNAVQTTSVIQPTWLTGGDYLIKVSGAVIGSLGGSYAGIANMAPVPLPPSLPLVGLGLGLLALLKSVRKRA